MSAGGTFAFYSGVRLTNHRQVFRRGRVSLAASRRDNKMGINLGNVVSFLIVCSKQDEELLAPPVFSDSEYAFRVKICLETKVRKN